MAASFRARDLAVSSDAKKSISCFRASAGAGCRRAEPCRAALQKAGVTILIAEQDTPRTLALAGRAYVIESGRVAFDGPEQGLLDDPRVREAYLGISESPNIPNLDF